MSTSAPGRMRQQSLPCPTTATGCPSDTNETVDPALVLLQHYQVSLITPSLVRSAERRLDLALRSAATGRRGDPRLLLEQLLTDLGVTLSLP